MSSRSVRLHRVLRAKPEKLYRAFLEADALAKWLPPYGFTCTVQHLEAKVGVIIEPRRKEKAERQKGNPQSHETKNPPQFPATGRGDGPGNSAQGWSYSPSLRSQMLRKRIGLLWS